jgi:hypothetical protein
MRRLSLRYEKFQEHIEDYLDSAILWIAIRITEEEDLLPPEESWKRYNLAK